MEFCVPFEVDDGAVGVCDGEDCEGFHGVFLSRAKGFRMRLACCWSRIKLYLVGSCFRVMSHLMVSPEMRKPA